MLDAIKALLLCILGTGALILGVFFAPTILFIVFCLAVFVGCYDAIKDDIKNNKE